MYSLEKIAMNNKKFNKYGFNEYGFNKYKILNAMYMNFSINDLTDSIEEEMNPRDGLETNYERLAILEATQKYKRLLSSNR